MTHLLRGPLETRSSEDDERFCLTVKQSMADCFAKISAGIMILPSSHSPPEKEDDAMGTAAGDPCGGGTPMKRTGYLLFMLLPLSFSFVKGSFASGSSGE